MVREQRRYLTAWMWLVGPGMSWGDRVKLWGALLEGEVSGTAGNKTRDHRADC